MFANLLFHFACITCNQKIQEAIWNSTFVPNLFALLSAFLVLAIIVVVLIHFTEKRFRSRTEFSPTQMANPVPLTTASMILGIGLGGFIDGIVLHQILQWHEMLSNKIPPISVVSKSINMFWDGIFHAFCLMVTFAGIVLIWKLLWRKDIDRSGGLFVGGLLLGWGLFNIVEGVIDHHLLRLHNVREVTDNPELWNWGFLCISLLMCIAGYYLVTKKRVMK